MPKMTASRSRGSPKTWRRSKRALPYRRGLRFAMNRRPRASTKYTTTPTNQSKTFTVQCKWYAQLVPQQGASVSNFLSLNFNPWAPESGLAFTGQWAVWSKLFDQYRVNAMTVRLTPRMNRPEATAITLANDATTPTVLYDVGRGYYAIDRDGPVNTNSPKDMQAYAESGVFDVFKPFVRTVTYPMRVKGAWLDCQTATNPNSGSADFWKDIGLGKSLGIYMDNLPENAAATLLTRPWCRCEIDYEIQFRGPRIQGVLQQVDEDGNPTGVITITARPDVPPTLPDPVPQIIQDGALPTYTGAAPDYEEAVP